MSSEQASNERSAQTILQTDGSDRLPDSRGSLQESHAGKRILHLPESAPADIRNDNDGRVRREIAQ